MKITLRNTKLFVGKKLKSPKNEYHLKIKFMHGDGDPYTHEILEFIPEEANELLAIIDILNDIKTIRNRDYYDVEGFTELINDDWCNDATCEDYLAKYNGHSLTYFNDDGEEFEVNVIN